MIIYNNIKYATSENELIDSLFNDGEGTLEPLAKIQKSKNDIKFFINNDKGFGITSQGVAFKFIRLANKKLFYQLTLDEDKESFKKIYNETFNK